MNITQLKQIADGLKTFVNDELAKIKAIDGLSLETFKSVSGIVHEVIAKIDQVKSQFQDITNEQMQQLAVDAIYDMMDKLLKAKLGKVGKLLYSLLPKKTKRALCEAIVDLIVNAIHRTKAKVLETFKKGESK